MLTGLDLHTLCDTSGCSCGRNTLPGDAMQQHGNLSTGLVNNQWFLKLNMIEALGRTGMAETLCRAVNSRVQVIRGPPPAAIQP